MGKHAHTVSVIPAESSRSSHPDESGAVLCDCEYSAVRKPVPGAEMAEPDIVVLDGECLRHGRKQQDGQCQRLE